MGTRAHTPIPCLSLPTSVFFSRLCGPSCEEAAQPAACLLGPRQRSHPGPRPADATTCHSRRANKAARGPDKVGLHTIARPTPCIPPPPAPHDLGLLPCREHFACKPGCRTDHSRGGAAAASRSSHDSQSLSLDRSTFLHNLQSRTSDERHHHAIWVAKRDVLQRWYNTRNTRDECTCVYRKRNPNENQVTSPRNVYPITV